MQSIINIAACILFLHIFALNSIEIIILGPTSTTPHITHVHVDLNSTFHDRTIRTIFLLSIKRICDS